MNKRKLMAIIHIVIAATIVGGTLVLSGCSYSNFDSALGGGAAGSNNCVAACGGCIGGVVSTFCSGLCTGCVEGCAGFF